ncbi:MAG: ammonium transporter [Acidimicrobiales bacterium]
MLATTYIPSPHFLSAGDTSWQLTAATLVGLMSLPGIAVLYGGIVKKKWAVNTMVMAFAAFSLVLVVWVLWAYKMGFGSSWLHLGSSARGTVLGKPGPVLGAGTEIGQASIPHTSNLAGPGLQFSSSALVYFQFVFAAITPLLFLGSVLGRMSLKAWLIFVPLWTTCAYTVNAMLLWGGGFWAQRGALDYSGGYVIHLAAGTTGFVAAAIIGPRLKSDRDSFTPNNLLLVAAGAGILWLGWNGFNGGDPYFANGDAAAAVLNTNLATAGALLTWLLMDIVGGPKRANFLGSVNGMIAGLVAITPAAGFVNGYGALVIGVLSSGIVWYSWNKMARKGIFARVDDALGVVHTHGVAGLCGGILVGFFADPKMAEYYAVGAHGKLTPVSSAGLFYGHPGQVLVQAGTALTIIVWDALVTVILLKFIERVLRVPLRLTDRELEVGDGAIHLEEVLGPEDVLGLGAMNGLDNSTRERDRRELVGEGSPT